MTEKCKTCVHNGTDIGKEPCVVCKEIQVPNSDKHRSFRSKYAPDHDGCDGCAYFDDGPDVYPCKACRGTKVGKEYYEYPDLWGDEKEAEEEVDMVNHPPHYRREGAMESIDEIKLILTPQEYRGFLLGNILKYRYRAADKNGLEDLKKSDWYAQRLKELDEGIFR